MRLMRRGTLNNKSVIFLLVGSVFTLLSFLFDQLVIQTEDKIRDFQYQYEESFNNYLTSKTIIYTTQELSNRIRKKKIKYDFQSDFLQKTVMTINFSPEVYDDYFNHGKGSEYNNNLRIIFIGRYLNMYRTLLVESENAYQMLWGLPIRAMDEKRFPESNKKVMDYMLKADQSLNMNVGKFLSKSRTYKIDDIDSIEKFVILRKDFNNFLDNFVSSAKEINEINKIYGQFMELYFQKTRYIVKQKIESQNKRNTFILISVICQIAGLLFLILLFKSLINLRKTNV